MDEITRLNSDLKSNDEFGRQMEQAINSALAEGDKSDSEAMVQAAKTFGYSISVNDLEKARAQAQEISDDELQSAFGGNLTQSQDEYGHAVWCEAIWHCLLTLMHNEAESHAVSCFSDYRCMLVNN